ncbi:MAG: DUF167 domain-containing protein [Pseudomonadota bacterium]
MVAPAEPFPFEHHARGLAVALRVQPGARKSGLEGLIELADGSVALKAKVNPPAQAGRANEALIKLLAKAWGLPRSDLELLSGHSQRRKTLLVIGDPPTLQARLMTWLAESGGRTGR